MYAIIETGGKQYRVAVDSSLRVEYVPGNVGDSVQFNHVHLIHQEGSTSFGRPYIDNASVTATIVNQGVGRKVKVFKLIRRKNYRRLRGHRQRFTGIRVVSVNSASSISEGSEG